MRTRRWSDLSPSARRALVAVGTVDAALRVAALVDLAHRPVAEVRGSKRRWATAIVLVSSGGVLPVCYFVVGRQPSAQLKTR